MMSDEQTRSKLDALMHEWHEWANRSGQQPEERYADCGGMADFVIKHMGEWMQSVPWCETHDEPMHRRTDYRTCRQGWASGCKLQDPPKVWRERWVTNRPATTTTMRE